MKRNLGISCSLLLLALFATVTSGAEKVRCAVLSFSAEEGVTYGQAGLLSNRFAIMLSKGGTHAVLDRYRMNVALLKAGFSVYNFSSAESAARAAAGRLEVRYVVAGSVSMAGDKLVLNTLLYDVKMDRVVKKAKTAFAIGFDRFLEAGPAANLADLVGLKPESVDEPPRAVAPEIVPVAPPVRSPAPPRQAPPKPPVRKPVLPPPVQIPVPPPVKPEPVVSPAIQPADVPEPVMAPVVALPAAAESSLFSRWRPSWQIEIPEEWHEFWSQAWAFLADRVEVGTRLTHFRLLDDKNEDGFVGSIQELDAEQSYALYEEDCFMLPANWFVIYRIAEEWGVELAWNKLRAEANNSWNTDVDGFFEMSGPIMSIYMRYVNASAWRPYVSFGLAWYEGGFDHSGWWANGYSSNKDYENLGPNPRNGKTRRMYVDDTWAFVVCGGTDYKLTDHFYLDLMVRYAQISTEVNFAGYAGGRQLYYNGPFDVPFDHYAFGLGLKYAF